MTTTAPLQRLIDLALVAEASPAQLAALAAQASCDCRELLDQLSLHVARAFADGSLSYEDGDCIMNSIFGTLCASDSPNEQIDLPDLTFEVYLAFDDGECRRSGDGPDVDPIEKYTRPQVLQLLQRFEKTA
ncbi:hypothetical protein CDN99_19790 [Roseateles aquatilis]|uniref:Uncharacterized protein n=1 Tax=Roseateles aquatilis TaxID=431061 RepID=A0A246J2X5_9BURK|nr:hypothetical protein [Roseateles aquatilis]OWQ86946.1 hypothetical protein CDN99_19790 [Roseateles aquatilis]